MEADGKGEKMNSNSIRDPGRTPSRLLENIVRYINNYRHRDPEHIEDTKGG